MSSPFATPLSIHWFLHMCTRKFENSYEIVRMSQILELVISALSKVFLNSNVQLFRFYWQYFDYVQVMWNVASKEVIRMTIKWCILEDIEHSIKTKADILSQRRWIYSFFPFFDDILYFRIHETLKWRTYPTLKCENLSSSVMWRVEHNISGMKGIGWQTCFWCCGLTKPCCLILRRITMHLEITCAIWTWHISLETVPVNRKTHFSIIQSLLASHLFEGHRRKRTIHFEFRSFLSLHIPYVTSIIVKRSYSSRFSVPTMNVYLLP